MAPDVNALGRWAERARNPASDMNVLVVDIGGTGVKMAVSKQRERRRFKSGPQMTPDRLVREVRAHARDWSYDAVAVGYPGVVLKNSPAGEPGNLACGWAGFDFERAFGRPVRVVNDAVMQALGAYDGGRMLFLGLGTGVGSALVSEHVLIPLELGSLAHPTGATIVEHLGRAGRKRLGQDSWQRALAEVVPMLHQ